MRSGWAAFALALMLSGCGAPPLVTALTYFADGALWAATGKTATEHGISAVTGQDCKMWRLVEGEAVCQGELPGVAISELPSVEPGEAPDSAATGMAIPIAAESEALASP